MLQSSKPVAVVKPSSQIVYFVPSSIYAIMKEVSSKRDLRFSADVKAE